MGRGPTDAVYEILALTNLRSLPGTRIILCSASGSVTKRQVAARLDRHAATIRLTSVSEIGIPGAVFRIYLTASLIAALCLSPASLARP
jgi:hypothetical protein